ncbi:MAG: hypothetical protein Q8R18_01765 [bacterium]|nr:hypothetical protein [bacterium]
MKNNDAADLEKKVIAYIDVYRAKGYTDDDICTALLKSGVPLPIIQKGFTLPGRKEAFFISRKWVFFLVAALLLFLFIVLLVLLNYAPSSGECDSDSACPSGYSCTQGRCVSHEAFLNCQVIDDCGSGYACYKCLEP